MLEKHFDPATAEAAIYAAWEQAGAFAADTGGGDPYTIVVPPPNVTGSLHVGHALNFSLQDILVRWRRMQGRNVLWQPGTDHAGIATQMVVERQLAEQGLTRQGLGREAFLQRVWTWKAESGGNISRQLRRLGASVDWSRERFTMDEGLSAAVRRCFVNLHGRGLIYRDRRLVNWDPKFATAISDLEVESREVRGSLWHLRYPLADRSGEHIIVATTRPETMLGDTAVAVNPQDPRYQALIGAFVILPLTGRRIPIVADDYSDPEKGSGAVKITPAHDFNDFEVGRRHNLPMPSILDRAARISLAEIELFEVPGIADPAFARTLAGLTVKDARAAMVAELTRLDLLEKIEPHINQVPHGDRSGQPVEPLLTTQWFLNAGSLAGPAVAAVEDDRTNFVPRQWENTYFAWMREIQPWCISRQLWWGHRIPAWYGPAGEIFVAETASEAQALAGELAITQDEDVLDTWFSSALWPFSTMGWPQATSDMDRRYPTSVLVTGHDIIFFWVARMMMMGLDQVGRVPFGTVYINALVRDERGQKMSKSKGNVIDPLGLIDSYGTDALRFTLCALAGPGRDIKLGPALVESNRSFVTKLWNAARFGQANGFHARTGIEPGTLSLDACLWILAELAEAVDKATEALEAFRFDDYAAICYRFVWTVYCDWFIELAKPRLADAAVFANQYRQTGGYCLGVILRLLHPVMPFVTEALWGELGYGTPGSLIGQTWAAVEPFAGSDEVRDRARDRINKLIEVVEKIRALRAEHETTRDQITVVHPVGDLDDATGSLFTELRAEMLNLALSQTIIVPEPATATFAAGSVTVTIGSPPLLVVFPPVDPTVAQARRDAERASREKEQSRLLQELEKVRGKLGSPSFVAKAKPEVVAENRERLARFETELAGVQADLQKLARVG